MSRAWLVALLCAFAAPAAVAADLRVLVTDQRGQPVPEAVVGVSPPPGARMPPPPPPRLHTINQVALTFVPYMEMARPGDSVVFHNGDRTRHHVYSFSAAKSFEFMLSPGQSSTPLVLDRAGVIAVGCNIHDSMINYLYVSDAPWSARTGPDGIATISGLPAGGGYRVQAWQPRLRPGRAPSVQENVFVADGGNKPLVFALSLLPDTRRPADRERARY